MEGDWYEVGSAEALSESVWTQVDLAGRAAWARIVDGAPVVIDLTCPHKFAPLGEAAVEKGHVVCPVHGACFDPRSGAPDEESQWAGRLPVWEARLHEGTLQVRTSPGEPSHGP